MRPRQTPRRAFDGFGPSVMAGRRELPLTELLLPGDDRTARRLLRRYCPAAPGVYGMIDAQDELIYVGKSKALRERLQSYFAPAEDGAKGRRIIDHTHRLVWEPAPHEFVALVREFELIRRWQPRFNVRGRGRFRRTYICLGRGPASYVYLSSKPAARDSVLFGPIHSTRRCRKMLQKVNNFFGLRDCPDRVPIQFADQRTLFADVHAARCMRHALGDCLGPCAGLCTRQQYTERVCSVRDFLRGCDRELLISLERTMRDAAAAQQYERAAALRDQWTALVELDGMLHQLRHVQRNYRFVYPLPGYRRGKIWCLIDRGHISATSRFPAGREAMQACLAQLETLYPGDRSELAQEMPEDLDATMLVLTWFRQHPEELAKVLAPDAARQLLAAELQSQRAVVEVA